jgi:hypothetical protein
VGARDGCDELVVWQAVAVFNDGASTNILSAPQVSERLQAATATSAATSAAATDRRHRPPRAAAAVRRPVGRLRPRRRPAPEPFTSTDGDADLRVPRRRPPPPPATPVVTTWTVTGGTVSVSCQAQVITLVYASPQDGWRVETEKHGTDRIDVNFQRVGQGTELRATCVNGVPQQTNQPTDGDR